jgi:hypothetical protein
MDIVGSHMIFKPYQQYTVWYNIDTLDPHIGVSTPI